MFRPVVAASAVAVGARALSTGDVAEAPIVVSGATGRSGVLIYNDLKKRGHSVRAFVRSAAKAKEYLGCDACDESEGIFVGDITKAETLTSVMKGAGSLVIATSAVPICDPYPKCHFPKGAEPKNIDWVGGKNQITAFAKATSGKGQAVLISTMGTTTPEDKSDPFDYMSFYKLNLEAELESSGIPFTIIKPCGLGTESGGTGELTASHDDQYYPDPPMIPRADVARVVVAALENPAKSDGLRFDLCSKASDTPTTDDDLVKVLEAARYPWEQGPADIVV